MTLGVIVAGFAAPGTKNLPALLRMIALVGDAISVATGKPFYLTSSRYRSMTSDYPVPMEKTFAVLGRGPYSLEEGIAETVQWLRQQPAFAGVTGNE